MSMSSRPVGEHPRRDGAAARWVGRTHAAEQLEVASILRENSLRLQRLIENLLSFAAWQAQVRGLELSDFKLEPLVRFVAESHQLSIAANDLQMDVQVEDLAIKADRAKLSLVFDNLLSNAIKFSPDGGRILICARRVGDCEWSLEVSDEGPGVPEGHQERIFEAFYQADTPQAAGFAAPALACRW